jgi:hypothetical protein
MAVSVQTVLDDRIAQYVNRLKAQRHETEAAVVRELIEAGYDEAVRQLHRPLSTWGNDVPYSCG